MRYLAQLPAETRVGGFLALGCWLSLDFETEQKRSDALERLVREDWDNFQRWTDRSTIDFQVSRARQMISVRRIPHQLGYLCDIVAACCMIAESTRGLPQQAASLHQ